MRGRLASRRLPIPLSVFLGLGLLCPATALAQRGALTLPHNLGELVAESATIVRGHVTSARVEPHPDFKNLHTVLVTVRTEQVFKGRADSTFTFRQYIWDVRDRYHAAGYRKGQHLLLLLTQPSRYGLSSPVGLGQGRFRILRDGQGREFAVNGHANAGLFRDLGSRLREQGIQLSPQLTQTVKEGRQGPVALDEIENLIRALRGVN